MSTFTGYPAEDTSLGSATTTYNNGAGTLLDVSIKKSKALLRYDLSGIPSDATITSASITFTKSSGVDTSRPRTCTLYKIADANGDWIEGTKSNQVAGSGEPCWDAKEADGSGGVTTAWAGSAGMSTAGTDYVNTSLGTFDCDRNNALYTKYTLTINSSGLAVLQSWFGDASNNGLLLTISNEAQNSGMSFYSRDHSTKGYRPTLTIEYGAASSPSLHTLSLLGVGK